MVHDYAVFLSATEPWGKFCSISRSGGSCVCLSGFMFFIFNSAVCRGLYNWSYWLPTADCTYSERVGDL